MGAVPRRTQRDARLGATVVWIWPRPRSGSRSGSGSRPRPRPRPRSRPNATAYIRRRHGCHCRGRRARGRVEGISARSSFDASPLARRTKLGRVTRGRSRRHSIGFAVIHRSCHIFADALGKSRHRHDDDDDGHARSQHAHANAHAVWAAHVLCRSRALAPPVRSCYTLEAGTEAGLPLVQRPEA